MSYIYNGIEYSLNSLSKMYGINRNTLYGRLKKGYTIEEAINKRIESIKIPYEGKEITVEELSKKTGIKINTIYQRIYRNRKRFNSDEVNWNTRKAKTVLYEGNKITIKELAELTNLKYCTVYNRLRNGETAESIVKTGKKFSKREGYKISYNGKIYSLKDLYKELECDISYNIFKRNILCGLSVEEAIKKPRIRKKIFYNGKLYTINELSKLPECVVKYRTLVRRIKDLNWSVKKALTYPVKQWSVKDFSVYS